jgi:glucose-fructose oxidoreductase
VSCNPDKAAAIARATGAPEGSVYSYESFDEIAGSDDVDVLYVITPNSLRRDLVGRAPEAGKHVLIEKPMASTSADCETMIAAAAHRKLRAHRLEAERGTSAREPRATCRS